MSDTVSEALLVMLVGLSWTFTGGYLAERYQGRSTGALGGGLALLGMLIVVVSLLVLLIGLAS